MTISFIRHGESISNAQQVFSSDQKALNGLTETGVHQIQKAANTLKGRIDFVYTSPFQRAVESAEIFIQNRPEKLTFSIDERIREINYGKHAGQKNSPEMAEVAKKQIAGDYEVRFGEDGENKREILTRLYAFLIDLIDKHESTDNIVVFSHGRLISILEGAVKSINNESGQHSSTNNAEIKQFVISPSEKSLLIKTVNKLNQSYTLRW